jgi:hypothetical protein
MLQVALMAPIGSHPHSLHPKPLAKLKYPFSQRSLVVKYYITILQKKTNQIKNYHCRPITLSLHGHCPVGCSQTKPLSALGIAPNGLHSQGLQSPFGMANASPK